MENRELFEEEMTALAAVYDADFRRESELCASLVIKLEPEKEICLRVQFVSCYPSEGPLLFEIEAPWLSGIGREVMAEQFLRLNEESRQLTIFPWIEWLESEGRELFVTGEEVISAPSFEICIGEEELEIIEENCPRIFHGEAMTDRKSTFQSHLAVVHSKEEVDMVIRKLKSNTKIARATHNISAYRFEGPNGHIMQDCDDDGEDLAGGRVMHLLQIVKAVNVIVVVSRWYGGIQLGADRFKHINNCARNILGAHGFIESSASSSSKKAK